MSTVPPEKSELTKSEARVEQSTEDVQLLQASIVEIERYRSMDRLIPSVHNVVTVATLEVIQNIQIRFDGLTLVVLHGSEHGKFVTE